MDTLNEKYETQPHFIGTNGDDAYTKGKWKEMIFRPYMLNKLLEIIPKGLNYEILKCDGKTTILIKKGVSQHENKH